MKRYNIQNNKTLEKLIQQYEDMSQEGAVGFFEDTVFVQIALYYAEQMRTGEALFVTKEALAQHPYSVELLLLRAKLHLQEGKALLALNTITKAEALSPFELEVILLRAEALVAMDLSEEALFLLEEKKEAATDTQKSDLYYCEACIHEYLESFDKMFYALKAALQLNPTHQPALERIYLAVELSRLYKESVDLHQFIIDRSPYSKIAWYNLGHAYASLDNYHEAVSAFEYAYIIDEKFEFAYRDCAANLLRLHMYETALKCLKEALQHIKPDADLYMQIGNCYEGMGKFQMALNQYRKSLEFNAFHDLSYYHIGECLIQMGNCEGATYYYEKAFEINPKREEYISALAEAYFRLNQEDLAGQYFRKAVDLAPDQCICWIQYASFLMETGRGKEALHLLRESKDYVGGTALLYCEAACFFALGRRKEGMVCLNHALSENYDLHATLYVVYPCLEDDPEILQMIAEW